MLTLDCTDVTLAIEDVESKCIDVVEEVNVGVEGSIGNILVAADILETVFSKYGNRLVIPHICHGSHGYTRVNFFWPV